MNSKSGVELEKCIIESIEVALDSFGPYFVDLVKATLEAERKIKWEDVADHPKQLQEVLRDICGPHGAETIESMISENIRSFLDIDPQKNFGMISLVTQAIQKMKSVPKVRES